MGFREASAVILKEIGEALAGVDGDQVASLCEALTRAGAVFVTGEGRSGLVGRCFAMRLMHLGLSAHCVGETVTPRLGAGDLLVAISGTGETAMTLTIARLAAEAGGQVAVITAAPESALGSMAGLVVAIAAAGTSRQYGGSRFEQASFLLLEAVVLLLGERLSVSAKAMESRHANIE